MLGRMKKIDDIYTFEDGAFHEKMLRISFSALVAGVLAALVWLAYSLIFIRHSPAFEFEWMIPGLGEGGSLARCAAWLLALVAGCLLPLPVHELVHGVLFKLFAPAGSHVTFGANWRAGMIYACAEGVVYTRRQYLVIALAPAIAVTAALIVLGIALRWPLWTIVVATVHLCGCAGDIAYVDIIRRNPLITHCEDTSFGASFYGEGRDDEGACGERSGGDDLDDRE